MTGRRSSHNPPGPAAARRPTHQPPAVNGPATHRARLEPALVRLRRRIRRIQWLRGASRTAVVLLAGLLALAAIDRWSTPPPAEPRKFAAT